MNKSEDHICDENVFSSIFRTHSKSLFNFLYYKFGGDNNPGDMVQEAFIKLWNNCKKVTPEKAKAFLFTVAGNQMLNELSKKKTALKFRQEEIPKDYTHETPEYKLEEEEYSHKLQRAIENLPEGQRTAFLLNRIENKKHREIAELLNISQKAVEKRIYTAVATLKNQLGEIF